MSVVISVTAITPTRPPRWMMSALTSGRFSSMCLRMSRVTSSASSGTRADAMTGMPSALVNFA
jgi:hypothetical protein